MASTRLVATVVITSASHPRQRWLSASSRATAPPPLKRAYNLDDAIMWYNKFLGFQVVGGEVIQCVPLLEDSEELLKDLNCTNDLFKFVRIMRERFHAAATQGCRCRE